MKLTEVRTCEHRSSVTAYWVRNNGLTAPIVWIDGDHRAILVSLTNQVIRISCPSCFQRITQSDSQIPDNCRTNLLNPQ